MQQEKSPLGHLTEYILSRGFFRWFKKTHLPYFGGQLPIFSKNRKSALGTLLRLGKKLGLPYSLFFAEVEVSSIEKGRSIPPHTDDSTKRLSFVLYLGGGDLAEADAEALGTRFFTGKEDKPAWSRYASGLLTDEEGCPIKHVDT